LPTYSGNIKVGTVIFDDLSEQDTAYTGVQWRSNLSSTLITKPSWLSLYPDGQKTVLDTNYGFDAGGMWFYGNSDNEHAYPVRTNLHLHDSDVLEVIATINFAHTGDDHGIAVFSSSATPIWKTAIDTTRIAFQFNSGIPVLYGQTTSNTAPGSPVLVAGNYYTVKFTYDPTNTVTVETYSGNTATGLAIDTRTISEILPAGDYVVGFDADQDVEGNRSYFTNLIVRTLTNTVVNDLEILGTVTGDLIPSANVTYDLGSSTARWNDLWLSGSTIHLGSATLSVSGGAIQSSLPIAANLTATNITVTGTRIEFASGGYIEEAEVLDGNASPLGYYGIALNSSDDGIISMNALDSNAIATSSVIVSNVSVQLNVANSNPGGNPLVWNFDNNGIVAFPGSGSIDGSDFDIDIAAGNDGAGTYGTISLFTNSPIGPGTNALTFNSLGELNVSTVGANDGLIKWVGNSSGDSNGYTTMVLVPDTTVEGNDQYLIIDPTEPTHIHIRAGGTQDNSNSALFLGGENSHVEVQAGENPPVYVRANNNQWMFDVDGNLTVPSSVIFADSTSFNGNTVSLTEGENFAFNLLAFVGGNYAPTEFSIYPTYIKLPTGNGSIKVGSEENNDTWSLDSTNKALSFPNNDIIRYNGEEYGLNLYTFEKSVVITAGQTNEWTFGNTGNLTVPGSVIFSDPGKLSFLDPCAAPLSIGSISSVANIAFGDNTYQTTAWTGTVDYANVTSAYGNAEVATYLSNYNGSITFTASPAVISGLGTITTLDANVTANLTAQRIYSDNFYYANGTPISFSSSSYGNAEVATYLPTYTGNITSNNVNANGSISANGSVNTGGNLNFTSAEASDTARIFTEVSGSTTSMVLEVGDDNADRIALRHYSFAAGTTLDMLSAQRSSDTEANVTIIGNLITTNQIIATGNIVATVEGFAIGYKEVPQVAAGNVTLALSDSGKHYYSSAASPTTLTIPSNANVAFPIGTAISIVNSGTGNITIGKQAEANLYLAGNAVNTTRTLTSYGMATVLKTATDQWFISGSGLE
jgi:hypothetical protein